MLCHWWHRDSTVICNPVSQNSEHGLPTEQRDWEVDWFEVIRKDQSRSFSVREKERGRREWRSRAEHRYTEVTSVIRWSNWGKTINHEEERGLLHESNPMMLRGSRGENFTVEKLQKRNMGLKVCSTLQAELSGAHMWQCHQVGCTVRSDCWWPEGKELLVQVFLKAFHVSLDVPDMRSDILNCTFVLVPSFCRIHLICTKHTAEMGTCILAGLRPPPYEFSFGPLLPRSSLGFTGLCSCWGVQRDWEGWVGAYFRRKRCASIAASNGLTGCASWPRRLTGGMLPNCRLVRKLLASWIVFFSSANSSCWRM